MSEGKEPVSSTTQSKKSVRHRKSKPKSSSSTQLIPSASSSTQSAPSESQPPIAEGSNSPDPPFTANYARLVAQAKIAQCEGDIRSFILRQLKAASAEGQFEYRLPSYAIACTCHSTRNITEMNQRLAPVYDYFADLGFTIVHPEVELAMINIIAIFNWE